MLQRDKNYRRASYVYGLRCWINLQWLVSLMDEAVGTEDIAIGGLRFGPGPASTNLGFRFRV